jgi:N-succinyldiaminopimelate aminotransferase
LDIPNPEASFYLWPNLPIDDLTFAHDLLASENVLVLPGSFLGRTVNGVNPGQQRVRMALVPPLADCIEAAQRIRRFMLSL